MATESTREREEASRDLAQLRELLAGTAGAHALAGLQARVASLEGQHERVERLAADLPEALKTRAERDEELTRALATPVERALKLSVARDPQPLVDAVFPVIGPAIRKAVLTAMQEMMIGFNAVLENSLSARALGWRFEALRTGRSFSEVALIRSLIYRVEQVFLIHRETGLVLHHATATAIVAQDADMVSGMLTAIQDFVRDSFRAQEGSDLDNMQVGELTVWVERASGLVLAVVIRGAAPAGLRVRMQDTLGEVARRLGVELDDFDGDPAPFTPSGPFVDALLESQQQAPSRGPAVFLLGLVAVAALWLTYSLWPAAEPEVPATVVVEAVAGCRWGVAERQLSEQPGIVVVAAERGAGRIRVLRDPLAQDPDELVRGSGIAVRSEPFVSVHPTLVLQRAAARLRPPSEVTLTLVGETLVATGAASHAWLVAAERLAPALAGVMALDATGVTDQGEQQWGPAIAALEGVEISFAAGASELGEAQDAELAEARVRIAALDRLAGELDRFVDIEVDAHHDPSGSAEHNAALRRGRADGVVARLQSRSLLRTRLTTSLLETGTGTRLGERVVNFRVVVPRSPAP